LRKLQTLPLLAGEHITQDFLTPTVAQAIDLVVHLGIDQDGARRIRQLLKVGQRIEENVIETELLFEWDGANYQRGIGVY
jgi:pilus assembly protein CpaF